MKTEVSYETTATCTHWHVINEDTLTCTLSNGHAGPHRSIAEDGDVWWQKTDLRKHHG